MEYTELLKEVESLKRQVEHYETTYKPVFEKHMQAVKEQALASYGLQADAVWLDRITADTEEGITEQVNALAVELRIQERNQPVDPGSKGNFAVRHKGGSVREHLYEVGRQEVKNANTRKYGNNDRYATERVSVRAVEMPAPKTDQQRKQNILARVFGRGK
jgi:hypothetical protein